MKRAVRAAKAVRIRQKPLAIFDIDGTIFRSSLLIELVHALVAEKIFPPEAVAVCARAHRDWLDRQGTYEDYLAVVIAAFKKYLQGVRYRDLRRVSYRVVAEQKNRTYRYTRDLVRDLKARGYYVLAVSHSPKIAAEAFAKTLGFNKVYGIMYAMSDEERFTGNILFPEIVMDKDKLVARTLAGGGLTLRGSIGVGDTESDIPFLKLVSRPICFNPNEKLYRVAKKNGWKVVVERKDVIYKW